MSDKSGRCVGRQGITVLGLLLLILALVAGGFFLVRYLRSRQPATRPVSITMTLLHQPLDQLNLAGVVEVVRGDAMDLLRVGPHALG